VARMREQRVGPMCAALHRCLGALHSAFPDQRGNPRLVSCVETREGFILSHVAICSAPALHPKRQNASLLSLREFVREVTTLDQRIREQMVSNQGFWTFFAVPRWAQTLPEGDETSLSAHDAAIKSLKRLSGGLAAMQSRGCETWT
jgi:hypothetical protein